MPFVLIIVGIILIDLAYQGSQNIVSAGSLLKAEFFDGATPFYKWAGAIILVGAIGYVPAGRPLANSLLILVLLAIILSNKNFASFTTLIQKV